MPQGPSQPQPLRHVTTVRQRPLHLPRHPLRLGKRSFIPLDARVPQNSLARFAFSGGALRFRSTTPLQQAHAKNPFSRYTARGGLPVPNCLPAPQQRRHEFFPWLPEAGAPVSLIIPCFIPLKYSGLRLLVPHLSARVGVKEEALGNGGDPPPAGVGPLATSQMFFFFSPVQEGIVPKFCPSNWPAPSLPPSFFHGFVDCRAKPPPRPTTGFTSESRMSLCPWFFTAYPSTTTSGAGRLGRPAGGIAQSVFVPPRRFASHPLPFSPAPRKPGVPGPSDSTNSLCPKGPSPQIWWPRRDAKAPVRDCQRLFPLRWFVRNTLRPASKRPFFFCPGRQRAAFP